MKRRLLSFLLSTILVLSAVPIPAFAEEATLCTHSAETEGGDVSGDSVCGICGEPIGGDSSQDSSVSGSDFGDGAQEEESGEEELTSETVTVTIEHEGIGSVYDVVPQSMLLFSLRDSNTWDADTNTYYGQLDEDSKKVYDTLKTAYESSAKTDAVSLTFASEKSVVDGNPLSDEKKNELTAEVNDAVAYAFLALLYDEPEMSWLVNVGYKISYQFSGVSTGDGSSNYTWTMKDVTFTLQSGTNSSYTADALNSAITTATSSINTTTSNSDDKSVILKAIHDYICGHVEYTESEDLTLDKFQTVHSALVDGETVCAGYAKAFKVLCDEYSIPCVLVSGVGVNSSGNSESHMWNYVQLDSNWYAVDCTWDDQSTIYYDYYLAGSDTVAANFGNTTFSYSHNPSGQWDEELSRHFAYPVLSAEKYDSSSASDETAPGVVYVSGSRNNAEDAVTGTGTSEDPYNDLDTALQRVKSGGTIQITDSITTIKPGQDEPFNITKPVTITGGTINCNYAGMILGADVTFENVTISFNNSVRNVIIANGHTLTLHNVVQNGTYPVHLFCGGITQPQNTPPASGDAGEIIITGTNNILGNIYAGSFSDYATADGSGVTEGHFKGSAYIEVPAESAGNQLGDIYATGGYELRGTGNDEQAKAMVNDADLFHVKNGVTVKLNGSSVDNVYGNTGVSGASVIYNSTSQYVNSTLSLKDISALSVESGILQPKALNSGVDIKIADGAELILSSVIADNSVFETGDFTGGGMLVVGQTDKLKITGAVSGTTEFQTDTLGRPNDKSTSGLVEYSYPYIDVSEATGSATFTFTPYSMQDGTTLSLVDNVWTTSAEPDTSADGLTSFALLSGAASSDTKTVSEVNTSGFNIPVQYEVNNDSVWLYDIPLTIVVTKDGTPYEAEDTDPDDGYYTYAINDLGFDEIYATENNEGDIIAFYSSDASIAAGTYQISITVPLVGQAQTTAEVQYTLTVTEGPSATLDPETPNGTNGWYQSASLKAPDGYQISDSENGIFTNSITISDGNHTSVPYWLQADDSEDTISKSYGPVKVDGTAPTDIQADVDSITHNSATLQVSASDDTSGVPDSATGFALAYLSGGTTAPVIAAYSSDGTFAISGMEPNTSYTFTLTVTDNAGNTATKSDITVTTTKKALSGASISLKEGVTYTYDGTAKQPTADDLVVTLDGKEVTLNHTGFSISCENNINAGTDAKVIITATDNNTTYTGTADGTFSIAKRPLIITAQPQTIAADGVISQELSMVSADDSTSFADGESLSAITLTEDRTGNKIKLSAAKIIKGTDDVTENYDITYKEGTLTIINSGISISISSAIIYDGNAVTAGTAGSDSDITYTLTDCENAEVAWYTKADQDNALTSAPVDAGEYVVKITAVPVFIGGSVTATEPFVIQKAELAATVDDQTITYGDVPPTNGSITYTGFVNSETSAVVNGTPTYSTNYKQYDDVDGTYSITANMENVSAVNYSFNVVSGSLTVNPLPVTLSWSGHTDRTYGDGTTVTAAVSNLVNNDAVQVTVAGGTETSVGSHTASATGLTGAKAKNYTLTGVVAEQAYTIEKAAALTGVAVTKSVQYNQGSSTVQLSELGLSDVVNPAIAAAAESEDNDNILNTVTVEDGTLVFELNSLTKEAVDKTAQITVSVISDSHEDMTVIVTVKIVGKMVVDGQITLTAAGLTYGEQPALLVDFTGTKGQNPTETYTYKLNGQDSYSGLDALKNSSGYLPVGTYMVKYDYEDDGQIGSRTASFEVKPKVLTVTLDVDEVSKVYDKTSEVKGTKQPELTLSGSVGNEEPILDISSVKFQYADENVGTDKTITASGIRLTEAVINTDTDVNKNYTVADTASGKGAKITPKTVTITPAQGYTKVYGETDSPLAYTTDGLLSGDVLDGTFSRKTGESVGSYTYDVSTLTNSNYTVKLSENAGTFTITPAEIDLKLVSDVVTQKAGSKVKLTVTAKCRSELQTAGTIQPTAVSMDGVTFTSKGNGVFEAVYTMPEGMAAGEEVTLTVKNADPNYQPDASAELILTISEDERTALPVPDEVDEKEFKLEMSMGISSVPETFRNNPLLNTVEKILTALKMAIRKQNGGVSAQNTEAYDVTLMYSSDGGKTWTKADKEHWPESGKLTVVLPYPEGTGKDTHKFTVAHMFTVAMGANEPGTFEYPEATNTEEGIRFQVSGLSPISLGWAETGTSGGSGGSDNEDSGNEDSGNEDSGNEDLGNEDSGNEDLGNEDSDNEDSDSTSNTDQSVSEVAFSTVTAITSPSTGDEQNVALWLMLAPLSAIGLIGIYMKGRKL